MIRLARMMCWLQVVNCTWLWALPYKFVLRSKDVLHNFTVPEFRVKMDLLPGMTPYVWAKPTLAGRYDILCEELCGIGHFAMRGSVVVEARGRV